MTDELNQPETETEIAEEAPPSGMDVLQNMEMLLTRLVSDNSRLNSIVGNYGRRLEEAERTINYQAQLITLLYDHGHLDIPPRPVDIVRADVVLFEKEEDASNGNLFRIQKLGKDHPVLGRYEVLTIGDDDKVLSRSLTQLPPPLSDAITAAFDKLEADGSIQLDTFYYADVQVQTRHPINVETVTQVAADEHPE